MDYLITQRHPQQGDGAVLGSRKVGKKTKEVFRVQFPPFKRPRHIDSSLNIFGKDGGVDGFGDLDVGGIDEVVEEMIVEAPELIEGEIWLGRGGDIGGLSFEERRGSWGLGV